MLLKRERQPLNFQVQSQKEFKSIIKLSLEFELAWLKLKSSMYSLRSNEENAISTINKRLRCDSDD